MAIYYRKVPHNPEMKPSGNNAIFKMIQGISLKKRLIYILNQKYIYVYLCEVGMLKSEHFCW